MPKIRPKTEGASLCSSSHASDRAKQFASLSRLTLRPSLASKSLRKVRPFADGIFDVNTVPSRASSIPGIPSPTEPSQPNFISAAVIIETILSINLS